MIADLISDVFKNDVQSESSPDEEFTCAVESATEKGFSVNTVNAGARVMHQQDQEQADFELAHLASIIDEL